MRAQSIKGVSGLHPAFSAYKDGLRQFVGEGAAYEHPALARSHVIMIGNPETEL